MIGPDIQFPDVLPCGRQYSFGISASNITDHNRTIGTVPNSWTAMTYLSIFVLDLPQDVTVISIKSNESPAEGNCDISDNEKGRLEIFITEFSRDLSTPNLLTGVKVYATCKSASTLQEHSPVVDGRRCRLSKTGIHA